MAKFQITGKAILHTPEGTKIVDAQVLRVLSIHADYLKCKHKYDGENILVGPVRLVKGGKGGAEPHPERIELLKRYSEGKFFKLMLKLMSLSQFNPYEHGMLLETKPFWENREPLTHDYSDETLFKKYDFTPEMVAFTEEKFL